MTSNNNQFRIVIPPSAINGYDSNGVISQFPSLADDNDYIPIHSMMDGEVIKAAEDDYKNFFYELSVTTNSVSRVRKFSSFAQNLFTSNSSYVRWLEINHPTLIRRYIGTGGLLIHLETDPVFKATPLIVLAAKKRYLFSINKTAPDPSQFCLLIDRRLILDEEHFKLYRNIKKHYVNIMEQHIDSMYSYDITKICFRRRDLSMPKFKTITEMMNYTQSINNLIFKD